ncbi:hAT family C-terminal dimerization region [Popillia japonica]|uniref:HAT family C-terminal dimerization region n=1 Tax=Popillia japonica TaxID=7064 RepID=A0AAW1LYP1_POPJA
MTVEISGKNYPTIPMIGCLIDQYNNYLPRYEIGKQLKTTLLKEIEKRFGAIEKSYIPAVSTILDPIQTNTFQRSSSHGHCDKTRFKQIHFRDPQAMGTVIRHIKSEITTLQNTSSSSESSDSSAEDPEFDLWAHHKKLAHTKKSGQGKSNKDSELNQYLSVPVRNLKDDLLDTWNEMKVVYPNLFKLAAKYSCVVATSVPSERIFSKAGATATKSRNRLTRSKS